MRLAKLLESPTLDPISPTQNQGQSDDTANISPEILTHINAWLTSLKQQNYSSYTCLAYRSAVCRFGEFVSLDKDLAGDWQAVNKKKLAYFLSTRLELGQLKVASVKQELSAISKFYQFAITSGLTDTNPAKGYRIKGQPRPLPNISDEQLMAKLLDQAPPTDKKGANLWLRDKAMFELLYSSGLRLSELVSLDLGDVDLSGKTVRVIGKGNKMRIVPVGSQAVNAIKAYLPLRDVWHKNTSALFVSERGGRITGRTVQNRLKAAALMAGIGQNLHPHILRHCFASHMLSHSGDLRAVQEMLGHSNISTTQIYTHVDFGSLTKVYDKAHPRAVQSEQDDE